MISTLLVLCNILVRNFTLLVAASLMAVIGVLIFCITYYRAAGLLVKFVEIIFVIAAGWAQSIQLLYTSIAMISLLFCTMFWIPNGLHRSSILTAIV